MKPNDAAVLEAMGVNPDTVEANTFRIEFREGQTIVRYATIVPVPLQMVAQAFASVVNEQIAAQQQAEGEPEHQGEGPQDASDGPLRAVPEPKGPTRKVRKAVETDD